MTHRWLGEWVLAVLAAAQGVAPLAIDLNSTHATNPEWARRARFQVVWQAFSLSACALLCEGLLWWPGAHPRERFYLAAILAAIPMLGFSIALSLIRIYGGALRDANGIPPIRLRLGARALTQDGNLLAIAAGSLALIAAVVTYRWGS
ncbi:MAG TPA: hypothetical protein VGR96_11360 [Acidobacteriaceae bacterium]|nr:hypothetical protein [Acidobacteriaceae bacterium]